jgi:Single-stranded DNA-binding replication protein A (RPA), large (70 kD) subunit and related ssDNA-binding proteins
LKIKDIRPGMDGITITARVVSVSKPKKVPTRYGEALVAQAIIADETGSAVLNLWRGQVKLLKPGDIIRIENAFAKEFRGRVELNVGKSGRIAVLKRGEPEKEEPEKQEAVSEAEEELEEPAD